MTIIGKTCDREIDEASASPGVQIFIRPERFVAWECGECFIEIVEDFALASWTLFSLRPWWKFFLRPSLSCCGDRVRLASRSTFQLFVLLDLSPKQTWKTSHRYFLAHPPPKTRMQVVFIAMAAELVKPAWSSMGSMLHSFFSMSYSSMVRRRALPSKPPIA